MADLAQGEENGIDSDYEPRKDVLMIVLMEFSDKMPTVLSTLLGYHFAFWR